ncbi:MAG TPA: carbon-nitrogen family hydrolase [Chthoniobacterales bacterium]|nr:carbon-nitrogen family hydrolase [Chthoniobacterales bacterium]
MRIFCCQFDIVWENKEANFDKVANTLANAALPPNSLVILPEMCFTGFSMNVPRIAEHEPARTEEFLATLAKRHQVYLVSGLVTQTPDGLGKNEAVFLNPSGMIEARYQKLHLFSPAGEHSFFERGNQVFTFHWQGGSVALFICYDLRFPEVFRAAIELGAELFIVVANWPKVRESHWCTLLQARAIENQAFVAGVNRCGRDPNCDYSGRSCIFGLAGELIVDAGENESLVSSELNWETVRDHRKRFPALSDRRQDIPNMLSRSRYDGNATKRKEPIAWPNSMSPPYEECQHGTI